MDPIDAVARMLGQSPDQREQIAANLRGGQSVVPPPPSGQTFLEMVQATERQRQIAVEMQMEELSALLREESPEAAWRFWQQWTAHNPTVCPLATKVFAYWEMYFPTSQYLAGVEPWERLPIFWEELLPEYPEEVDKDSIELKWLRMKLEDTLEELLVQILMARAAGEKKINPIEYLITPDQEKTCKEQVTLTQLAAPPTAEDHPLTHLAWQVHGHTVPQQIYFLMLGFWRYFPTGPAPRWAWEWIEANPEEAAKWEMTEMLEAIEPL